MKSNLNNKISFGIKNIEMAFLSMFDYIICNKIKTIIVDILINKKDIYLIKKMIIYFLYYKFYV